MNNKNALRLESQLQQVLFENKSKYCFSKEFGAGEEIFSPEKPQNIFLSPYKE